MMVSLDIISFKAKQSRSLSVVRSLSSSINPDQSSFSFSYLLHIRWKLLLSTMHRQAVSHCSILSRRRRRLPSNSVLASLPSICTYDVSSSPKSLTPLLTTQHAAASSSTTRIQIGCANNTRKIHTSHSILSDNLLGHSPMARSFPNNASQTKKSLPTAPLSPGSAGPSWGVDANTAGGGVWAQNSSKREKLNELLTELNAEGVDTGTFLSHDVHLSHVIILQCTLKLCFAIQHMTLHS